MNAKLFRPATTGLHKGSILVALERSDPAGAAALWSRIDHELVTRAFWVPTVNVREIDLVSPRLRNYVYQPVWGFLPGQASVS